MQTQMMTAHEIAPPATAGSQNPWLTVADYARRNGVSIRTVWYWMRKGAIEVKRRAPRTGVRVRDCVP